jgi:protein-L-isoaspartate O-methyltransferase
MLQQAREKVEALGLTNITFEQVDADEQELQESRFDAILCLSAIVYLTDIPTQMLEAIGFEKIKITTEQLGSYLQDAETAWTGNAKSAFGL